MRTTSADVTPSASARRAPSPASPTTVMSGWESMTSRKPARTSAWSSTRKTRITRGSSPPPRSRHPGRGPARSVPPRGSTRSRMPARPRPTPSAEPRPAPSPSSRTTRVTARGSHRSSSEAAAPGPACLSTFVSASWATRYDRHAGRRRDRARVAPLVEADRQPGLARALDERRDLRRRRAGAAAARSPREPRTPSARRISPCASRRAARDRAQGLGRGRRVVLGGVAPAVGLRDHDGERVRDDVVQLARDPCALIGRRGAARRSRSARMRSPRSAASRRCTIITTQASVSDDPRSSKCSANGTVPASATQTPAAASGRGA